jgi:hypothetical protein
MAPGEPALRKTVEKESQALAFPTTGYVEAQAVRLDELVLDVGGEGESAGRHDYTLAQGGRSLRHAAPEGSRKDDPILLPPPTLIGRPEDGRVELLYLDLILTRDLPPTEAARVVGSQLVFSGDVAAPGSPLGGARFQLAQP